jgi:hypothetical protein
MGMVLHGFESPTISTSLHRKLNPARFPRIAPIFAALVGYIIGAPQFATPALNRVVVNADGFVLIGVEDGGGDEIFSTYSTLLRNWQNLIAAAGLTLAEHAAVDCAFAQKIGLYVQFMAAGAYEN